MKVSFVIPTLEEEDGIVATIRSIDTKRFQERGHEVDVLVVDAESKDRTQERAEALGARVVIEPRRGYGRAYKTGFAEADGDVIVTGDADGTYPLDHAHEYVDALLERDLDFITCDRYGNLQPGSMSRLHRLGNGVLSMHARLLFGIRLRDSQSGMWIIRRSALEDLSIETMPDTMAFSQEIKIQAWRKLGGRAAEMQAELRTRIGEPVIASWRDGFGNLGALWRLRFR